MRNGKILISKEISFQTTIVVAIFLFQFIFLQFVKSESQVSPIWYTIQQKFRFKTKFRYFVMTKMISRETSFKTLVVVAIFLI